MNIALHMERLVLDGIDLPPAQRALLQAAVEAELTRLLTERGLSGELAQGGRLAQLGAQPIEMAAPADPVRFGQQIAQSVFGSIAP